MYQSAITHATNTKITAMELMYVKVYKNTQRVKNNKTKQRDDEEMSEREREKKRWTHIQQQQQQQNDWK